ncbi:MAG TPA: PglZ domain-containing protein, partial [Chitinophagales bacterium]|nr:PglZ domain-containing protein [Chitinophagales bacterium]
LIYIYHNHIDDTGDKTSSEVKVFEAVETEINFLKNLLRQIANVNGTNILITADHGYIYQNDVLEESDFAESGAVGDIWKENRRFVIGSGLSGGASVKKFNGTQVGLTSDVDILIPKGINRLRVKGAGSRFVHGGASLQEVIVPVLTVSKKRKDTTSQVDVDLIKSTDKITTNILAVTFIQKDIVSDKVLSRSIRAAIKAEDGTLLSDTFSFNFDIDEGTERERAVAHRFQLSAAASGKYKGQRVSLVIEEPVPNSSKWKTYSVHNYTLNISFMNDFDDF